MVHFERTFKAVDLSLLASGIPASKLFYPSDVLSILKMNCVFLIAYFSLFYAIVGQIIYLVQMFQRDVTFLEVTFQVSCFCYCSIGLMKMTVVAVHRNAIAELVNTFRDYWKASILRKEHKKICDEVMIPAIHITTAIVIVNVLMETAFTCLPIPEMIYNHAMTGEWVRQLPFLIWWGFDPYSGTGYYFMYPLYIVMGFFAVIIHMGFDSLFCVFSAHLCMHFRILKFDLEQVVNHSLDEDKQGLVSHSNLLKIVRKHQNLERCLITMNKVFSFAVFYNFFVSSFIVCIQVFMVTTTSGYTLIKFALFLTCFLIELFLLCLYGQAIVESSGEAADAAYNCKWYNMNRPFCKIILQMMVRAQKPFTLMAWKFWPVNLQTFASILSASWSYFTLLRTVYAD